MSSGVILVPCSSRYRGGIAARAFGRFLIGEALFAVSIFLAAPSPVASAQQRVSSPARNTPTAQSQGPVERVSGPPADGITRDQADEIVVELRLIRQLLEKQQEQLQATHPLAAVAPVANIKMNIATGWQSLGSLNAPVTMVEFTDLQCPYCRRFHVDTFPKLKADFIDTGKLRFFSTDLPLGIHAYAKEAAEAVRCAEDQGKFWELRDALLSATDPPTNEIVFASAEKLGLDAVILRGCVESAKYKNQIEAEVQDAAALGITATPTFVVGRAVNGSVDGFRISGAQSYETFRSRIQDLLAISTKPN